MRTIKRIGKNNIFIAKCPYCGHRNKLADGADVCDHLYEVGELEGFTTFHFVEGYDEDIRGKRVYREIST